MDAEVIRKKLASLADREKAKILQGFFKTGPGQYGEGDVFLGITVPILRKLARECRDTTVSESLKLLRSPVHEARLLALLLFISHFDKGDDERKEIYELYRKNTRYVNNWDLVDLSAPNIVGAYLVGRSRRPLYGLARSPQLWERRIAIVATLRFIRETDLEDTFRISELLLDDECDLIHKAVGWMLREAGKRDERALESFLRVHCRFMPRTMLRYAIERLPEAKRRRYLEGAV